MKGGVRRLERYEPAANFSTLCGPMMREGADPPYSYEIYLEFQYPLRANDA